MDWKTCIPLSRERILSDDGEVDTYPWRWWAVPPNDPWAFDTTSTYLSSRLYRKIWDKTDPLWRKKVNEGVIMNNGLLDFSLQATFCPLTFRATCDYIPETARMNYTETAHRLGVTDAGGIVTPPTRSDDALLFIVSDPDSLRSEAITKSFARVDVSELEMLASLGELPETVSWFKDVLKRLIALLTAMKKRQLLETLKQLKLLSRRPKNLAKGLDKKATGSWMEFRYALMPLIFEVQAYLEALDTKVEKAYRKTARAKDTSSYTQTSTSTIRELLGGTFNTDVSVHRQVTEERLIRAGVLYSLDPTKTSWWSHLGLDAPTSAFWAVTTLSFMIDWFFNIGQWIASWEPRIGLTPLTNWVVETRCVTIEATANGTPQLSAYNWIISDVIVTGSGKYTCVYKVKARWVEPERQILPTFKMKDLGVAQIADLVIIGRQLASQLLR